MWQQWHPIAGGLPEAGGGGGGGCGVGLVPYYRKGIYCTNQHPNTETKVRYDWMSRDL